jgi:hypothetical protein
MLGSYDSSHFTTRTEDGSEIISGGCSYGTGFCISWQNGAILEADDINGAFVETIIDAARDRIEAYQQTISKCDENQEAIEYLQLALAALNKRTNRKTSEGKEGTHKF